MKKGEDSGAYSASLITTNRWEETALNSQKPEGPRCPDCDSRGMDRIAARAAGGGEKAPPFEVLFCRACGHVYDCSLGRRGFSPGPSPGGTLQGLSPVSGPVPAGSKAEGVGRGAGNGDGDGDAEEDGGGGEALSSPPRSPEKLVKRFGLPSKEITCRSCGFSFGYSARAAEGAVTCPQCGSENRVEKTGDC